MLPTLALVTAGVWPLSDVIVRRRRARCYAPAMIDEGLALGRCLSVWYLCLLSPRDRLTEGGRHAETDLRHEPVPGRLHRRARRRHRLERAERRAVRVVDRPDAGGRSVAVRAQAVGDDERLLADRRPAARRQPGGDRVRAPLAEHAEGGVL